MLVILLRDIRNLGHKNEIKNVKDGYARNVLLPQKLVQIATDDAVANLQEKQKQSAIEKEKLLSHLALEAESLKNIVLKIPVKASKKGEIFGSVSAKNIEKSLAEQGFKNATAILKKPLKKIGEYQVEIDLGERIKSSVKLLVKEK